jgi:peptidoglycan/LPS O-acetylase OafA/YrhL
MAHLIALTAEIRLFRQSSHQLNHHLTIWGEVDMSSARRVPSLDGLRGVAAIAVMMFHFNIFFLPQSRLSEVMPFIGRGYVAVDLFFLLSGFVMAHVYGRVLAVDWRTHWPRYAIARFARIYPLFVVVTLSMLIVVLLSRAPTTGISFSRSALLMQPLLIQQWYPALNWDYPSWSISTEAEAYLFFVFAAGVLLTGKHPRLMAAGCIIILTGLSIRNSGSLNYYHGASALLRTLAGFSLGVLLHRAYIEGDARSHNWVAILAILLAGLAALTRFDIGILGAFVCLMYYAVNAKGLFGRLLNSRPLVALGNWSYSIYLWHAPTHCAVMAVFAASRHPVGDLNLTEARLLLLATSVSVVALAAVHYRYVETPLRLLVLRAASAARFERPGIASLERPMRQGPAAE